MKGDRVPAAERRINKPKETALDATRRTPGKLRVAELLGKFWFAFAKRVNGRSWRTRSVQPTAASSAFSSVQQA